MFDPMLFSPSVGHLGLGPSSENFAASTGSSSNTLFTPADDDMRLSGPPSASDTLTMSAHRSLFAGGPPAHTGLRRSMSHAVLNDMDSGFDLYGMGSTDSKIGSLKKESDPGPVPQPLGLRSSSSCPNLQELKKSESDDAGDSNDKVKKRKARKAEVARQCRKRKKAYIQSLEEKAKALAEQLSAMSNKRHKGGAVVDRAAQHRNEQNKLLDKLGRLVARSQNDDNSRELKSVINSFTNNSRKRQKLSTTQMQGLRDCLSPGVDTKFALWLLLQNGNGTSHKMWDEMLSEVKLTKAQINKMNSHKNRARELKKELDGIMSNLASLQKEISRHLSRRHSILDQITSKILNPKQTARLLLWVQQNPSCMGVLETVWKAQAMKEDKRGSKRESSSRKRTSTRVKKETSNPQQSIIPDRTSASLSLEKGPFASALAPDLGDDGLLSTSSLGFDSGPQKGSLLSSLENFMGSST
uniref:BZIP domain-containing protein n=1 Tax=Norrisiella sphaerica TaxID=552664 RepID=A0A7S2VVL6_9EUKA|mmetsp:Transcript_922/g.1371  ORF Transcript_922/g.1371 Transcript_922/m.1371 type:complete len:469 (+) Transcript_922:197-1603(+)